MQLASRYGRYGYRRVSALLRRDGWRVNHKRVERIWRLEGLKVPAKQPKRGRLWFTDGSCVRLRPQRQNHVWAYDFVALRTRDGRPVRLLTVVDEYTRECLAIEVGRSLRSPTSLSAWETSWWSTVCRSISVQITALSSLPGLSVHGYREWGFRPSSSHQGARGRTDTWRASMASCGMSSWIGRSSILSGRCRSSRSNGDTNTTMCALTAP